MAESIDFQFPMKKACGSAIKQFCSSVPHNHARVIRCLQVRPLCCSSDVLVWVRSSISCEPCMGLRLQAPHQAVAHAAGS